MIAKKIRQYLEKSKSYSVLRFITETTLITFVLKLITYVVCSPIVIALTTDGQPITTTTETLAAQGGSSYLFITALVLAPIVETIVGQWIPIVLMRLVTSSLIFVIVGSAILFAVQHYYAGPVNIFVTFPVGVVLSGAFIRYERRSWLQAFLVTMAIHLLHNLVAVLIFLLIAEFLLKS